MGESGSKKFSLLAIIISDLFRFVAHLLCLKHYRLLCEPVELFNMPSQRLPVLSRFVGSVKSWLLNLLTFLI